MKRLWEPTVGSFTRHEVRVIRKRDFPPLLAQVWQWYKPEWAIAGFWMAGVVPYNPDVVPESSFAPSEVFQTDDNTREESVFDLLTSPGNDDGLLTGPSAEPVTISQISCSSELQRYNHLLSLVLQRQILLYL